MELLELYEGLRLADDNNFTPLEINIDLKEIITMLKNENLHYNPIIHVCRSRLRRLGCPVVQHS